MTDTRPIPTTLTIELRPGDITGRVRFRRGWFGSAILQVEYVWAGIPAFCRRRVVEKRWRDASFDDGRDFSVIQLIKLRSERT